MDKLLHNCPNCGAPLTSDGYCEYCKTKIRYANHVEILNDFFWREQVEMLIKIRNGDTTTLIPFVGHLTEMRTDCYMGDSIPEVSLRFDGRFGKIPETEVKDNG